VATLTARDLLGVFVRLAGLAFIQYGLFGLYYIVVKLSGIQTQSQVPLYWDVRGFVLYCAWGIVIILAAKPIVRLAYWLDK
jgi:hypothetical protein